MAPNCQCAFCLVDPEFTDKFKKKNHLPIRRIYKNRCCVCLNNVGRYGVCVPILLTVEDVEKAMDVGILEEGFDIEGVGNGVLQCKSCHINFFSEASQRLQRFTFSLPLPLLCYLHNYVKQSPGSGLPKMSINELLDKLIAGDTSNLPLDPTSILPYVGLYAFIHATPRFHGQRYQTHIHAPRSPGPYTIQGTKFAPAPDGTTIDTPGAVRIFDAQAISDATTIDTSRIRMDPGFRVDKAGKSQKCPVKFYWRLPIKPSVVLAQILPITSISMHDHICMTYRLNSELHMAGDESTDESTDWRRIRWRRIRSWI